jgi:hypothetical protein
MPCAKQTFTSVTQQQFDCIANKASSNGLAISGNSGIASKSGFEVSWNFDPANQVLEIQALKEPFFVPCSKINSTIHDIVDECVAQTLVGSTNSVAAPPSPKTE